MDLIKAYDTANHSLLIEILEQYGAPPKLSSAIQQIYQNLIVLTRIGTEKKETSQIIGVRQGDNLSPVLFRFLSSAFVESVESEWKATGLSTAKFPRAPNDSIERGKGQLIGHKLDRNSFLDGQITEFLQI